MTFYRRPVLFLCFLLIMTSGLFSCSKPKEGKVAVVAQNFAIRQLTTHRYTIDATGKIKNTGDVDLKKVVVTAYCKDCYKGLAPGKWTVSERERTPEEKDVIDYLPAGREARFKFTDVAIIYTMEPGMPNEIPKNMQAVIQSFKVAD